MFTAGRIIRSTSSASRRNTICATSPVAVANKSSNVYRCYVPFVWQSLMTSIVGVTLMFGGITLCVVGFYATSGSDKPTSGPVNNDTKQALAVAATAAVGGSAGAVLISPPVSGMTLDGHHARRLGAVVERGQDAHVTSSSGSGSSSSASMSYLGPVLMGVGCFAIIASVVVVCEVRERMIILIDRLGLRRSRRESSRDGRSDETRRRWTCKSLPLPFQRQRCRPEVADVGCRHVEKLPFKRDLVGFISLPLTAITAGRMNTKNSSVSFDVAPSQNIVVVTDLPAVGEQSHSTDTVIVISEQRNITMREQIEETNGNGVTMAPGVILTRDDGTVEECLQHQITPSLNQRDKDQTTARNCPAVSISFETEQYPHSTDLRPEPEIVTGSQNSSDSTQTVSIDDQPDDVSGGKDERSQVDCFSGHRQRMPSDDIIVEFKGGSSTFRRRLSADSVLSTVHEALGNEDDESPPESPSVDEKIDDVAVKFESKTDLGNEISCLSAAAAVGDETLSSDCKCNNDTAGEISSDQVSERRDNDVTMITTTATDDGNREQGSLEEGKEEITDKKLPGSGASASFDSPEVVTPKDKAAAYRRASEPFSCQQQSKISDVTESDKPDSNPASLFSRQQTVDVKPAEASATTYNSPLVESTKQQWSPNAERLWSSDAYYLKTGRRQATKMSLPPASHSAVAIVDVMGCMSSLKRSGRDQAPS